MLSNVARDPDVDKTLAALRCCLTTDRVWCDNDCNVHDTVVSCRPGSCNSYGRTVATHATVIRHQAGTLSLYLALGGTRYRTVHHHRRSNRDPRDIVCSRFSEAATRWHDGWVRGQWGGVLRTLQPSANSPDPMGCLNPCRKWPNAPLPTRGPQLRLDSVYRSNQCLSGNTRASFSMGHAVPRHEPDLI